MTEPITWTLRTVDISTLTDYYKNPRSLSKAQFDQLKTSLDKFGMIDKPIINLDSANTVIGGHQRLHILRADKVKRVECWYPSRLLTDKEVEELNIRLNKNTGNWDFDALANGFEVPDLLEWGFDERELQLGGFDLDGNKPDDPGAQIDKAAELQKKWQTATGQLWQLGEHRLICGDCTNPEVITKLMGSEKGEITFIDPPYNALKSWHKDEAHGETRLDPSKWFENDNMEWPDYWNFIERLFKSLQGHSVYVCCDYRIYAGIRDKIEGAGYEIKHCIVWKKNVWGLGKRYRFQHEFIVYACKGDAPFYGGHDKSDVWEIDIHKTTEHNTPKPVELPEQAIQNSSAANAIIFDGCLGSGTTLIACERLHRKCRAVEISAGYCAVTLQRFFDMTGILPELMDLK